MASSNVNVKMGVSGVSQFKQDISSAKQAVKTLDAQLDLCKKQFEATGDKESYMTEKAALLKAKLEKQKKILENSEKALQSMASKGVDKASASYQNMYRQTLDAKGAIIETETAINNMTETETEATKQTRGMNTQIKKIGKGVSLQNVTDGIDKITKSMEKAAKKAVDLGKKITKEVLGAGSWADDLSTQAKYYQIDEEQLQRMQKTAALIDTPVDAIIDARKRLKKETSAGKDETMNTFAALGIDPSTAEDAEDLFWKVGSALMDLDDEFAQEEYAQKLLGRSWEELIPLFEAGREKYDELNDSWNVVPQEQLDALKEMDDQYQKLTAEIDTIKMTFLGELAEPMKYIMETITGLASDFGEYLKSPEGQKTIADLVEKVKDAFDWIKDNKDVVVGAIEAIGVAFVGLKLAKTATNIWRVVDGFTNLLNLGGGSSVPTAGGSPIGTGIKTALGGKIGAGLKSFLSGAAVPAGVLAASIIPAELARAADEKRWAEQKERWSSGAEKLTGGDRDYLIAAAKTMEDVYRPTGDQYSYLMGMQNRSDLQKMQLHNMLDADTWTQLMEFWRTGGENMADFQVTQLFNDIADAYARMAEQTDEITGATDKQTDSNKDMTEAADEMKKLPKETASAVRNALNGASVVIDGAELTAVVGNVMAGLLARYSV